ncbi:MAG: pirin family protein, partial [Reyranella sp.]|nr:pirin family protein [Reyranella sp.]
MIELRPFEKLGKSDHGWLKANFHFSFADYRNNDRVHWGALRVWNNDRIAPQSGFPPHPHRDMEIVTYVIRGAITHKDHLGNEGRTEAGQIQVMSAGAGIQHAEYNME